MKILSLDMSSKKSGYALFDGKRLIDYGCWEMSSDDEKDWRERIYFMSSKLIEYLKDYDVDLIIQEDVLPAIESSQTVKILSNLQGCIFGVARANKIDIEYISVSTWKTKLKINLTHSREFKAKCRLNKGNKILPAFKKNVKAFEKKLSVDLANHIFDLDLIWKSPTSKSNMDDISDAINIGVYKIFDGEKYELDTFENIINFIWDKTLEKSLKRKKVD